jgi:HAD superfamily hydrolase (TIGR01509 family)
MKKDLAIIFDFDGTIAQIIKSPESIVNVLAQEFGFKKIKADEVEKLKEKKAQEVIKLLKIPLIKLPFILLKGRSILSREMERLKPFKGMEEVIDYLCKNKYEFGILTSNSKENVIKFLKKNQMDVFKFIFSEKMIFGKGNALLKLIKKRKLKPENVFFIGDETRDIEAARKAKIKTIAVSWGLNKEELLKKQNPDYIARVPKDLIEILKNYYD